ncbi:hypothetical protein N0V90_010511 [Kalmusia sp. IMI 367209]|nr:hypothetical protein N0V90_010511 [Kalmusia sp. IMI 367209]
MAEGSATSSSVPLITAAASIAKLNRGPITKYYEPAESCSKTLSLDINMYYGWGAQGILDTACYPRGTKDYKDFVSSPAWDLYYYSPAICPGGWAAVTKFTSFVDGTNEESTMALGSDTTAQLCCPSGFEYSFGGHVCTSAITRDQVVPYVFPTTDLGGNLQQGKVSTSTYPSPSWAFANGVVVMWQSTDVSVLEAATKESTSTSASASATAATAGHTTGSSVGTPTPTNTAAQSTSDSGGLSNGAKIGIGVSIPLAVLLGLAFGFFLFRRRRAAHAAPPPGYDEAGMVKYAHTAEPVFEAPSEPPEMGAGFPAGQPVKHERHELQ